MERKTYKIIGIIIGVLILIAIPVVVLSLHFFGGEKNNALSAGPKLVIDHDGGADDAMAIFMALLAEDNLNGPPVIGLTTTHGNVDESQSFINSQRILDIANRRDMPIYRGSNFSLVYTYPTDHFFGHDGLGDLENVQYQALEAEPQHAAIALIELSKKYEGELVVVALGSLTNIALAVKLDAHFISRLSQLYVGSGHVYSADHPTAEFNALIDVESYHIVADNSIPDKVTIVPFSQILDSLNVTREWRENVLGSIPTEIMRHQNLFERFSIDYKDTWTLLDPAVMALVLDNHMVESTRFADNSIMLCGDKRGINTNDFADSSKANVNMINSVNEETYKELLLYIFSSELLPESSILKD